jgi:membrane-bound lytic murein transglycosylase A
MFLYRMLTAKAACIAFAVGLTGLVTSAGAGTAMKLTRLSPDQLPGWQHDSLVDALKVLDRACAELVSSGTGFRRAAQLSGKPADWHDACRAVRDAVARGLDEDTARRLVASNFSALKISGSSGQFTGYFEPEFEGALEWSEVYSVPVLARPDDLVKLPAPDAERLGVAYGRVVNGKARPYHTRQQIEQGKLAGKGLEIAWLKSWADLFFMQVQGSGRLRLPDGRSVRLAYSLKTGLPYTSIGKVLIDRGEMTREGMSMQALRAWLAANPGKAREVMWQNQSYVFFRRLEGAGDGAGPVGAQGLPLTPFRSLAVDRSFWSLGVPVWVSTQVHYNGEVLPFDRMMVAQDTGSAIRGPQRGDIYFGSGGDAGRDAGLMDEKGMLYALVPHGLADRLVRKFRP